MPALAVGTHQRAESRRSWQNGIHRRAPSYTSGFAITVVVSFLLLSCGLVFPPAQTAPLTKQSSPSPENVAPQLLTGKVEPAFAPEPNATHDLTVTPSSVTALAGDPVTFSASVPGSAVDYLWNWGDGTNSTTTTSHALHTYANPGIYLIYVAANNSSGHWHDNLDSLLQFLVQDSFATDVLGNQVEIGGSVVANSTDRSGAAAVAEPGGFVQVSNWIAESPTNPNWQVELPGYQLDAASGVADLSNPIVSSSGLDAVTVGVSPNASAGVYELTFGVPTIDTLSTSSPPVESNFSFTVFVGPGELQTSSPSQSPHPGTLQVYQNLSALPLTQSSQGPFTMDPAVTTRDPALSLLQNVYQTLVSFNGSSVGPIPSDFVPNLAMCVPGSPLCEQLFGSSLVTPYNNGTAYTFVINPNASFYNGTTGAHAPVWPNDVAFSLVRSCLYADVGGDGGGSGGGNGGIYGSDLCYSLLGNQDNASWDGQLHGGNVSGVGSMNNTPPRLLSAIMVNNSAYCSSTMMDGLHGDGCVTLSTNLSFDPFGNWPDLLAYLASPSESVESCNWMAANGLGLPNWTIDSGTRCSSNPPNPPPPPTGWDTYMRDTLQIQSNASIPDPARYNSVGSGPYYLAHLEVTGPAGQTPTLVEYTLEANPYWGGTSCVGGPRNGCLPGPKSSGGTPYISQVEVNASTNSGAGDAALSAGTADLVQLPTTDSLFALNGLSAGEFGLLQVPTPTITFMIMALNYSPSNASTWMGTTSTLPSWGLQDLAFRNFLSAAYPHATLQREVCSPDGTGFCFQYGGLIPSFTGSYTPTNLTWPVTDPNTNASVTGSAAWWWNVTAHDSMVGAVCNPTSSCTFPLAIPAGDSGVLTEATAFVNEVESISHGAITPVLVPIPQDEYPFETLYYNDCNSNPSVGCRGPTPFALTWQVETGEFDQPDDYFSTMALMNGPYAGEFGMVADVQSALNQYSAACQGPASNPTLSQACQHTALIESDSLISNASGCPRYGVCSAGSTFQQLLYNMGDHIFANLSVYIPMEQVTTLDAFAPWIDPTTLDLNPELGALGAMGQPFYNLQYASVIPQGYPLYGGVVSSATNGFGPAHLGPAASEAATVQAEPGQTVPLLLSVSGGTGIYHYVWNNLPPGCSTADRPFLRCAASTPGTYQVTVTVTDSAGHVAEASVVTLTVVSPLAVAWFSATPSTIELGQTARLNVSAQGGFPPYSYSYSGLPAGCSSADSANLTCTPTATGSFTIHATVTDAGGITKSATLVLVVSGGFLGLPGNDGYYVLVALAVAAAAIGVIVARSARKVPPGSHLANEERDPYLAYREAVTVGGPEKVTMAKDGETDPASDLY